MIKKRYVLFVRGINVGRKNSLPMAALSKILTEVGCSDVQTYLQSGNAVFHSALNQEQFVEPIEAGLKQLMGRPIATTVRTYAQMQAVIEAMPFKEVAIEPKHLCVTFLPTPPTEQDLILLGSQPWAPESWAITNREIYSCHPNGQARSALAEAIGKLAHRRAGTTRNWNTVRRLEQMLSLMAL